MTSRSSSGKSTTKVVDQQKIDVVRAYFDAANAQDLDRADRYLSDEFLLEDASSSRVMDKRQARAYNEGFIKAFPDGRIEILRTIAQDDYVVLQYTLIGTHTGPLTGPDGKMLSPTNRRVRVVGCVVNEVKQDKITHAWDYWDLSSLLSQLGALPPI